MDITEIRFKGVGCIRLAENRDYWGPCGTIMNLRILQYSDKFPAGKATISSSTRSYKYIHNRRAFLNKFHGLGPVACSGPIKISLRQSIFSLVFLIAVFLMVP
jgi:hypothetical protein